MNPIAIANIRASYEAISPRLDRVVERFYSELFRRRPEVRRIFPTDMARQKEHLAAALAMLFRNLENMEGLEPSLMSLGAQHVAFGALPEHYPVVRDCLLAAVAEVAAPAWSSQLEDAWREAFNRVCSAMLKGAAASALAMAHAMSPAMDRLRTSTGHGAA